MAAHAADLRSEVEKAGWDEEKVYAYVHDVAFDPLAAQVEDADRALIAYAVKLTRQPEAMGRVDVDALRAAGFDDVAVSHATQVVALFSYYNRIVDGLGADPEIE